MLFESSGISGRKFLVFQTTRENPNMRLFMCPNQLLGKVMPSWITAAIILQQNEPEAPKVGKHIDRKQSYPSILDNFYATIFLKR